MPSVRSIAGAEIGEDGLTEKARALRRVQALGGKVAAPVEQSARSTDPDNPGEWEDNPVPSPEPPDSSRFTLAEEIGRSEPGYREQKSDVPPPGFVEQRSVDGVVRSIPAGDEYNWARRVAASELPPATVLVLDHIIKTADDMVEVSAGLATLARQLRLSLQRDEDDRVTVAKALADVLSRHASVPAPSALDKQ